MHQTKDNILLNVFVNPIGTSTIVWQIPSNKIEDVEKIIISLPSYKYDLPRFASVPVPLSSKAFPLTTEIKEVKNNSQQLDYTITEDNFGNRKMEIPIKLVTFEKEDIVTIKYQVKEIVNSDGIFFVFVYAFSGIIPNIKYDINLKARLSYTIRKYRFMEWYFDLESGKKIKKKQISKIEKKGDLVTVEFENLALTPKQELDLHLTGTRMPFFIRRDYFWILVFLISIALILSPIWSRLL